MFRKIELIPGTASYIDSKGKKTRVESLYTFVPDGCNEIDGCLQGDNLVFQHSTLGLTTIPLEQLHNFLVANNITDIVLPAQMVITSATGTAATTMNVAWDETAVDANLASVELYRDAVLIATITATNTTVVYGDTGLTASTSYSYTIIGVDDAGNRSPISAAVVGTTTA